MRRTLTEQNSHCYHHDCHRSHLRQRTRWADLGTCYAGSLSRVFRRINSLFRGEPRSEHCVYNFLRVRRSGIFRDYSEVELGITHEGVTKQTTDRNSCSSRFLCDSCCALHCFSASNTRSPRTIRLGNDDLHPFVWADNRRTDCSGSRALLWQKMGLGSDFDIRFGRNIPRPCLFCDIRIAALATGPN